MPESEPEQTGRDRLLKALRTPARNQVIAAVLLGVLGFAAVVQVRAHDEDNTYRGASQQDLIQLINSQEQATERVRRQITSLESDRDSLRNDTADNETALELAQRQANSLGVLAGTLPAQGPGVVITVDGPPASLGTEQLLEGIQELRDAGAEAIQIGDKVRVVGSSAVSAGPGDSVMVDGEVVELPVLITAIGDPDALRKAIFFPDGFSDAVSDTGGTVTANERQQVKVAAVRDAPEPRFAEPVPAG
ncbi:MAG: DUF881 domain-containing protein [Nocardioidaceae bacterium]